MDQAEWLASENPVAMLAYLAGPDASQMRLPAGRRVGRLDRKLRLFTCAVVWLSDGGSSHVRENVEEAYAALDRGDGHHLFDVPAVDLVEWELRPALVDRPTNAGRFAAALRCIVGNPFRPASATQVCPGCGGKGRVGPCGLTDYFRACLACGKPGDHAGTGRVPAPWLTQTVLGIARRAYDKRDFTALPVLADALEEAGCEEESVLRHLRGEEPCPACPGTHEAGHPGRLVSTCKVPWSKGSKRHGTYREGVSHRLVYVDCTRCGGSGWILGPFTHPHVRGCHVVDLVLGKE